MRYLFILALLFIGCDEDSTSPDAEECHCPAPGVETSSTEQCEVITDNDCLEYCEIDSDDIYEGWIPVCTDCLANDDCDDAVEAYEECFGCLDNCDDEDAPPGCIDYCTQLYCP